MGVVKLPSLASRPRCEVALGKIDRQHSLLAELLAHDEGGAVGRHRHRGGELAVRIELTQLARVVDPGHRADVGPVDPGGLLDGDQRCHAVSVPGFLHVGVRSKAGALVVAGEHGRRGRQALLWAQGERRTGRCSPSSRPTIQDPAGSGRSENDPSSAGLPQPFLACEAELEAQQAP